MLTEQLWDLPLRSKTGRTNLDDVARSLYKELKNTDDDISFVESDHKSDGIVQLKFEIVKHIINIKLEEGKEAAKQLERKANKQHIMELITKKKDEALAGKSLEELQSMLDQL